MTTVVEPLEGEQLLHTIELTPNSQVRARRYIYNDVERFDLRTLGLQQEGG